MKVLALSLVAFLFIYGSNAGEQQFDLEDFEKLDDPMREQESFDNLFQMIDRVQTTLVYKTQLIANAAKESNRGLNFEGTILLIPIFRSKQYFNIKTFK